MEQVEIYTNGSVHCNAYSDGYLHIEGWDGGEYQILQLGKFEALALADAIKRHYGEE